MSLPPLTVALQQTLMHAWLLPLIFLACLITTSAQPDYDEHLSTCTFDSKHPHIAPPHWLACHELLAGLPDPSRPATVPKIIMWPIVLSNEQCTAVIKPNAHPRKPTRGSTVDWAQVHRQATILIYKCFREARPAHKGDLFMEGFLTRKHGFPYALGADLAILMLSTPYDRATHNLAWINTVYSNTHLALSSYGNGAIPAHV